jgi:hypothetical protein
VRLLAIDPGNVQTACVVFDDWEIAYREIVPNDEMFTLVRPDHIAIEYMKPRGMPTSKEEMDTQFWAGRFVQHFDVPWTPIYRMDVKIHVCGYANAKDKNIRQAMLDRFGGKGTKKSPGPLFGFKDDLFSALAIGVTWLDKRTA